ncbi:SigE family RNA polymerase sigma factor [Kineosporia babensis]|uniref:SigE family RNA polymerase sigma factor n=1 Tax=Kineosporia babensis TaxID=499548 RepID=A0A9X1NAZ7_9ACTN|nr:SigE family RNA polymerase sigma factor [Kineosporia babensis]MCD5311882.1 SigE family RNA polymerase sigma factor [Kineosporia babensis]
MDDESGFRQFVNARWPALVQSAYLITLDRGIAEDCVQEALARVHRRWNRTAVMDNPEAYVRKAVVNAAFSWRRKRRVREVPLEHAGAQAAGEPVTLSMLDADDQLVAALRSLPPQMRAAVVLRYVEDRSEMETAHLLGCTVGAVKSATSRGVSKLRVALGAVEGQQSQKTQNAQSPRTPSMTAELINPDEGHTDEGRSGEVRLDEISPGERNQHRPHKPQSFRFVEGSR